MEEFLKNIDLQTVPMQTLAFIGDAVYNVYIQNDGRDVLADLYRPPFRSAHL